MNPQLTKTQQQWLTHIQAAQKSGLSYSAYAKHHGLSADGLFNAKHVLQKKGIIIDPSAEQAFVKALPLQPEPTLPLKTSHKLEISLPNGIQFSITADRDLISEFTQALLRA